MDFVILGLLITFLIVAANLAVRQENETFKRLFDLVLLLFNVPFLFLGLAMLLIPADYVLTMPDGSVFDFDFRAAGPPLLATALLGTVVVLKPVRRWLAGRLPLKAESAVHALALLLAVYLTGNTLVTLSQGGLEGLAEEAQAQSILLVLLQGALFIVAALLGVGLFIRRDGRQLLERLDFKRPTLTQLMVSSGLIGFLVVAQLIAAVLWSLTSPESAESLNDLNSIMLADIDTIGEWLLLGLSSGIGEELLFRGAIQPVFGLWMTSLLFAIAHIQYGITPITLFIFLLGLTLGLVKRRYSTTMAIYVHAGYNFTLGLLLLLATYAEQFMPELEEAFVYLLNR